MIAALSNLHCLCNSLTIRHLLLLLLRENPAQLLDFIGEFGSASRKDIDDLLMDKLSDVLTKAQKKNRISNLLAAMARKDGSIRNQGSDKQSAWVLIQR